MVSSKFLLNLISYHYFLYSHSSGHIYLTAFWLHHASYLMTLCLLFFPSARNTLRPNSYIPFSSASIRCLLRCQLPQSSHLWIFFFINIYLFERERECQKCQRERERMAGRCLAEHRAQLRPQAWFHDPKIMTWAEIKSWVLKWLNHLGIPHLWVFYVKWYCFQKCILLHCFISFRILISFWVYIFDFVIVLLISPLPLLW